ILRINVGEGSGAAARRIRSHEAEGYEPHAIPDFRNLLRPGRNVLAIEGHNDGANSSDFSLDPYLIATSSQDEDARPGLADYIEPAQYSSSSRALVAFDRHTGSLLWSRAANYS